MPKKKDYNTVRRSAARGANQRGYKGALSDAGKDALNISKKGTKGHYQLVFSKQYNKVSEKDIQLRKKYAKDLIADHLAVPVDMLILKAKGTGNQTLTALDEVFYVKLGSITYGKVSIRTQRLWKGANLLFIYQSKGRPVKPVKQGFGALQPYKKKTPSQVRDERTKADRKRKDGTH